ncbi:MAG: hypothetical protein E7470_00045 [Ruminococcaceae bacterium]|nr:hypothetical protein [Oscillospiraceae bacterium]
MKIKITLDKMILILATVLLIFHTFTFFQAYYNFIATAVIFLSILILDVFRKRKCVFNNENKAVWRLAVATLVVIAIGILVKGEGAIIMWGSYLPFIMWPTIYVITEPIFDVKSRKKVVNLFLVIFAIGVIATLRVVMRDNEAARLLAGAATEAERAEYYKQGVGGYGFIYGTVFVLFCLLTWAVQEKNATTRIGLIALIVPCFMLVIFASYTAALLLTLVVTFLSIYTRTKRRNTMLIILIGVVVIVLLWEPILLGLYDVAKQLELHWIVKRIRQLLEASSSGDFEGLKRVELYELSLDTFINNIWIGGEKMGAHSFFFDSMAKYGLFGVFFISSFCAWLNDLRKKCSGARGMVYFVCMMFLCINTMDVLVFLPIISLLIPVFLQSVEDRRNHQKA